MMLLWLGFIVCTSIILYSGTKLSRYGDVIAEKTGLGRVWIGLVLMASVTSLPELITGISSVAFADVPNIALGDRMGSCVFNLSIIALMDILHAPSPIFSKAEHGHILSAGFGVVLIGVASISILSNTNAPSIGHIGLYTPAIILIYLIAVRNLFLFERRRLADFVDKMAEANQYEEISMTTAIGTYSVNALFIVGPGSWLPFIGDRLAEETGPGRVFIRRTFEHPSPSPPH